MKILYAIMLLIGTIPQTDKLNSISHVDWSKTQLSEIAFQNNSEPFNQIGNQKIKKKKNYRAIDS